jgi:hypothetical protein
MHTMKRPQNGYLPEAALLAFLIAAYVLVGYIDQQGAHTEQHQSTGEKQ